MNPRFGTLLAILACGPLFAQDSTESTNKPGVELAGLKIIHKTTGKGFDGLRPFNTDKGAEIALLVTHPDKGLIAFDKDKSQLELFTDDQGKALCKSIGFMEGWGNFPQIEKDGSAILIDVTGRIAPSPTAKALKIRGSISVIRATKIEKAKLEGFKAQKGEAIKVGPFDFKINQAGKPDWGSGALQVSFSIERDIPEIKSFRFLDAEGKEIKTRDGGTSRSSAGDSVYVSRAFVLDIAPESLNLEIEYYGDMTRIQVPVNLDISIGGAVPGSEAKKD